MNGKCLICDKPRSLRKLKSLDDEDLKICDKISETFNIQFNDCEAMAQSLICIKCIEDLNISCEFFRSVQRAKERLSSCKEPQQRFRTNDVLIKVEVKEEPVENRDDYDETSFFTPFDYGNNETLFFTPFDNENDNHDDDDDDGSGKEKNLEGEAATGGKVRKKTGRKEIKVEMEKPKKKYRKLLPEQRKKNRGLRRAKEASIINPSDLYINELKGLHTEQPEYLQIPEEDKLPKGQVSNRITQLYQPTSWQSYKWSCDHCSEQYPDILQLNEHLKKIHNAKYKKRCDDCYKTTHHFAAFINHITEFHTPHNKFCCIFCPQTEFRWDLKQLFLHYQTKHRKRRVVFCIYCGFYFTGGALLKEHLILKHKRMPDEKPLECDICGLTSITRCQMSRHMHKHMEKKTFMCDQCPATFTEFGYLNTHIRQVHSISKVCCRKCNKEFKNERRLRFHNRTVHLDNKKFVCHFCQKTFQAKYRLNEHIRVHTNGVERKHQCSYCERRFKYKPGMMYHIRATHTGETPYSCPIEGCRIRFFDYSNARKHISTSHNSSLKPLKDK